MNNYRLNFYIGTGEDRDGVTIPEETKLQAMVNIRAIVASEFGGYTETQATGGWLNEAGRLIVEPAVMLSAVIASEEPIRSDKLEIRAQSIARYMARMLNQSAVMYTMEPLQAVSFVSQEDFTYV